MSVKSSLSLFFWQFTLSYPASHSVQLHVCYLISKSCLVSNQVQWCTTVLLTYNTSSSFWPCLMSVSLLFSVHHSLRMKGGQTVWMLQVRFVFQLDKHSKLLRWCMCEALGECPVNAQLCNVPGTSLKWWNLMMSAHALVPLNIRERGWYAMHMPTYFSNKLSENYQVIVSWSSTSKAFIQKWWLSNHTCKRLSTSVHHNPFFFITRQNFVAQALLN